MNYIIQINSFWERYGMHEQMSPTSIAVYFALLHLNNISGWKKKIRVHPREVMDLTMIGSTKTLYHHLHNLKQLGLVNYEPGKNQHKHTYMVIPCLYGDKDAVKQKVPTQSNGSEKATKDRLPEQHSQSIDNQYSYETPKLINNETSKPKTKKNFLLNDLEKNLLSIYQQFIKKRTGLPAKISAWDKQSLKNIARYLLETDSPDPVAVWNRLLRNWEKLSAFYQAKISMEQIDKNFMIILNQIENYHENDRTIDSTNATGEHTHSMRKDFRF